MTDMSQTISPKSDQLNSDDLVGGPISIKVTRVSACNGNDVQPIAVNFEGDSGKPYKPCKSMRRVMVHVWGKDGAAYVGRSMTLYRDPTVTFGKIAVGGIRISHMSHIEASQTMALTASRASRLPYTVKPLVASVGEAELIASAQGLARANAAKGTAKFIGWWNTDEGKGVRHLVESIMPELKEVASKAEKPAEAEDPFGLPPADDHNPTPSEMAAAEEAANEASKQHQEQENV